MVLADPIDVPPERKPERGHIRILPRNENWNEGTSACSPGTKTGTRVHSPKPHFHETALYLPANFARLIFEDPPIRADLNVSNTFLSSLAVARKYSATTKALLELWGPLMKDTISTFLA